MIKNTPFRQLSEDDKILLECKIDATSLHAVLDAICLICAKKASHIRESYSDHQLANDWNKASMRVASAVNSDAVAKVS
jgi:hypothetical protein